MIIPDAVLPLKTPLPLIVEATAAFPNVSVFPFKSKISVAEVKVMAFPPFGPSVNKSTPN